MAPAHDTYARGINLGEVFNGPLFARQYVVIFVISIVDLAVKTCAIPSAASVFWRNHNVPLIDQLGNDMGIKGIEVAMYASVNQHHQWQFCSHREFFGNKGIGLDHQRIFGPLARRVTHYVGWFAGVTHFVDGGYVAEFFVPHQVVDLFG